MLCLLGIASLHFSFPSSAQKAQPAAAKDAVQRCRFVEAYIPHFQPQLLLQEKAPSRSTMGNVASGRRPRPPVVEERLTQPQRLVMELPDMDAGRLRRLIRSGDLAPCFDAAEDAADGHVEECPICFYVRMIDRPLFLRIGICLASSLTS
jgi:hypothetical protein